MLYYVLKPRGTFDKPAHTARIHMGIYSDIVLYHRRPQNKHQVEEERARARLERQETAEVFAVRFVVCCCCCCLYLFAVCNGARQCAWLTHAHVQLPEDETMHERRRAHQCECYSTIYAQRGDAL